MLLYYFEPWLMLRRGSHLLTLHGRHISMTRTSRKREYCETPTTTTRVPWNLQCILQKWECCIEGKDTLNWCFMIVTQTVKCYTSVQRKCMKYSLGMALKVCTGVENYWWLAFCNNIMLWQQIGRWAGKKNVVTCPAGRHQKKVKF